MTRRALIKSIGNLLKKPLVLFLIFSVIGAFIYFLRFPNNFSQPNFYAEDGSVFLTNIQKLGFGHALFSSFNGYFVIGLYIIEGLGYVINFIGGKDFVDLASSFAIASYIFLGMIAALPFLLFKKHLNLRTLLLIFILAAFIPMPGFDYAIIGTIGNTKFVFVYIAFLLLIYRHLTPEASWKRILITDVLIAVCAYTNIVVYPLLLFSVLRYIPILRKEGLGNLFRLHSFQSLIGLGVVLIPQLIYIKLNGIPPMPGYLDAPYQIASSINLFVYRPYLFPLLSFAIKNMNDVLTVVAAIALFAGLWLTLNKWRSELVFGVASIFIITALFVLNRTGVSTLFISYSASGPDQFFYTQNLIMCFLFAIGLSALITKIKSIQIQGIVWIAVVVIIFAIYIPHAGSFGKNDFMQNTVGNIYENAEKDCKETGPINIQLYPVVSSDFQLKNQNRSQVCTDAVTHYIPSVDRLGLIAGSGTFIPSITKTAISQTFTSNYTNLDGIGILFLTYKTSISGTYQLNLYDNSCTQLLRSVVVDDSKIRDGQYSRIAFNILPNSNNQMYCYTLSGQNIENTPLAVSLSNPDVYKEGSLKLNGVTQNNDIMMELYYAK